MKKRIYNVDNFQFVELIKIKNCCLKIKFDVN